MAARKSPARTRKPAARALPDNALEIGAIALGAFAVAASATLAGLFFYRRAAGANEGHAAPDLARDTRPQPQDRAPVAFRPDMDAPMTAAEREALRPAAGPAPSIVAGGFLPNGVAGR